jgi:hypothetical protein
MYSFWIGFFLFFVILPIFIYVCIVLIKQKKKVDYVYNPKHDGNTFSCPCCGNKTLSARGFFEVCPICFWEDDGQDDHDADVVRGGPNGNLSLTQARRNYQAFGACEQRFLSHTEKLRSDQNKSFENIVDTFPIPIKQAHEHTTDNRIEIESSEICGCISCKSIFSPSEIAQWLKEGTGTALCPKCGIDAVIGSSSGFPITLDFLSQMNRHWFGNIIAGDSART